MDGIAGVYAPGNKDVIRKIFLATGAQQHRGGPSSGIAFGTENKIYAPRAGLGRIVEVVDESYRDMSCDLSPIAAIGNVGYTKKNIPAKENAEPIEIRPKLNSDFHVTVTMNGYIVNDRDLEAELDHNYHIQTGNKSELFGALLHQCITETGGVSFEAGKKFMDKLKGRATYAMVALVNDGKETYLVALNDGKAFEPFCFGHVDDAFVVSSESCSHRRLGGFMEREYRGGEMTICSSKNGVQIERLLEEIEMPDIFQAVYFGNPGSLFLGKEISLIRRELGVALVEHYGGSTADIVIPNPASGFGVSEGLAIALGLPLEYALVKNSQAVRTFQEGQRNKRNDEVEFKFTSIDHLLLGKRVAMGDDSIVRGSVSEGGSVWCIRNAGVTNVEFWVSYAPMLFPSFKEWRRGRECMDELAARRAFNGDNPYAKPLDETNKKVARLICVNEVFYNTRANLEKVAGNGSYQALDASYPIDEKHWPPWLREEVEKFRKAA